MTSISLGRATMLQEFARTWALPLATVLIVSTAAGAAEVAGRVQLAQAQPPAQPQGAAPAKSKPRPAEPAASADATLQRRVEQLEEQLVDMQVTIGTLESLARSGGGGGRASNGAGGASLGASEAARIEGMETQMRALTSEVQRLTNQVRQLGGASDRGDAGGARPSYADAGAPRAAPAETTSVRSSFGSTTVTAGGDPIGSLIDGQPQRPASPHANGHDTQVAALPPATSSGSAKQDYETAYGHLLKQDYGAAETAFEDFLQHYPSDALAGNAQYWLGETHFVRGSFKAAAGAFLKGYQNYGKGNKAPDSLLKLAMSLERLGQKDAACSSFGELVTKFPHAPEHVKTRAAGEQKRLGCR